MRQFICLILLSVFATSFAAADIEVAEKYVPDVELVGKARLKVFFWKVYDAELYAPHGKWSKDQPFALTLHYLRSLKGKQIAKRTVKEWRGLGIKDEALLERWFEVVNDIIPDVDKNTRITGVRDANNRTLFYKNGELIGTVDDAEFTDHFFDIWLGQKSSQPKLRDRLLGLRKS